MSYALISQNTLRRSSTSSGRRFQFAPSRWSPIDWEAATASRSNGQLDSPPTVAFSLCIRKLTIRCKACTIATEAVGSTGGRSGRCVSQSSPESRSRPGRRTPCETCSSERVVLARRLVLGWHVQVKQTRSGEDHEDDGQAMVVDRRRGGLCGVDMREEGRVERVSRDDVFMLPARVLDRDSQVSYWTAGGR